MWNLDASQTILVVCVSLILGAILGFFIARWRFVKQLQEVEKNYQKSVRKTYQLMGASLGRKMKEEELNKITTQLKEETEKAKDQKSTKIKPKKRKKK